jgi:cytoskeletal protein CcmA (bactofilin family)
MWLVEKAMTKVLGLSTSALLGLVVGLPHAMANDVPCPLSPTAGTTIKDNIVVVASATECDLNNVKVQGNVKVLKGGRLRVRNGSVINGNIQADEAASIRIVSNSTVKGDVEIKKTSSVPPTLTNQICNTHITGTLKLEENATPFDVGTNPPCTGGGVSVDGNLQAFKNADVDISNNNIAGNLQCKENVVISGGGNTVGGNKEDQCATF